MKNIFLLSILFTTTCFAQVPRTFSLVVLGNQTNLEAKDLSSESGMGYGVGFAFNWGYHETFNYEVEALYNRSTFKLDHTEPFDDTTTLTGQDIVITESIDLLFHMNYYFLIPEEDKIYMGVQGGVFGSISNGSWEFKESSGNRLYGNNFTESSFEILPKMNGGINLGFIAGYNHLRLSLKYNMGLTNALRGVQNNSYDDHHRYTGPSFDGKLNSISMGLYYMIY